MELKEFYKGEMVTCDFQENTMTFEIEGDFKVVAGEYFIFSKEALQNYTDKICKKQRENCKDDLFMSDLLDWRQAGNVILSAEQPKIEEI